MHIDAERVEQTMNTFTPICNFVTSFAARDAVKVEQHNRRSTAKNFMLMVSDMR